MELNPSFIERNGKKEFVVLPYEEFMAVQTMLEDAEDLLELRQAKLQDDQSRPSKPLGELLKEFNIE